MNGLTIDMDELREAKLQERLGNEARRPIIIVAIEVSKERAYKVIGTDESEVRKNADLVHNWLVKGYRHVD